MSTKLNKREVPARDRSVQDLSTSPQGPRPGYFIVRKSGEVVPLVAVDELPLGVDLVGVPRSLDLVETGGMLNLGLQGGGGEGFYGLIGLEKEEEEGEEEEDVVTGSSGSDTTVSSPLLLPIRFSTMTTQPRPPSSKQHSPPGLSTSIHAPNPRIQNHSTSSLGTQQQAQQQTCRHWCTHNRRCKWGDNCRYKHVMPRTRFELGLIGLSDWPDWFKKENLGFFPGFERGRGRGLDRLRDGGLEGDVVGGMERMERVRERSNRNGGIVGIVGREVREREMERGVGMGIGILEGERVLERLREMEKLLKLKGASGKCRDKNADAKPRDEKRIREKEKEKIGEREKEREREDKLEIRKAEAKKERERLRNEKAREKEVSGRIDRGDVEGARRWEDDSVDEEFSGDGGKGRTGEVKERIEKGGKREAASGEKEKLVDV
ncbi:hypothetical protein EAF04_005172 [Stromatinia cepivora]|nr:hypothetical protein EAF04_005172 [Stromatinia cepivora]